MMMFYMHIFWLYCSPCIVHTEYVSQCTLVGAGGCCLDIGFRHMVSAPDCTAFGGARAVWRRPSGNHLNSTAKFDWLMCCQPELGLFVGGVLPNHLGHSSGCQLYA